jgi:hypothetical protein
VAGERVETIRDGHGYFNRGDTSWTRDSAAEDAVWGTTGAFPGTERVYQGPAGVEDWVRAVRSEWSAPSRWSYATPEWHACRRGMDGRSTS